MIVRACQVFARRAGFLALAVLLSCADAGDPGQQAGDTELVVGAALRQLNDTAYLDPEPGEPAAPALPDFEATEFQTYPNTAVGTCGPAGQPTSGDLFDARGLAPSANGCTTGSNKCYIRNRDHDTYNGTDESFDIYYCKCTNTSSGHCGNTNNPPTVTSLGGESIGSFVYDDDNDDQNADTYVLWATTAQVLNDCVDDPAGEDTIDEVNIPGDQINPGATDTWYDGVDQNCDGKNDFDQDEDGFVKTEFLAYAGGTAESIPTGESEPVGDCNDGPVEDELEEDILLLDINDNATTWTSFDQNPNATEVYYDGIDLDCSHDGDGQSDFDRDGDGDYCSSDVHANCSVAATEYTHAATDCVDDPVGQSELAEYINTFTEAGGPSPVTGCMLDEDGDGYGATDLGSLSFTGLVAGSDCDDDNVNINPGESDVVGSSNDENCDGQLTCHRDEDEDGFGNNSAVTIDIPVANGNCQQPSLKASNNDEDCLDDPTVDARAAKTYPRIISTSGWNEGSGCYTDVDEDGYGANAANKPAAAATGTDCNDAASSCTNDCTDVDGDGHAECLDLCGDVDQDDYGTDRTTLTVGSATIPVGSCTTDGTTPCTFLDAVCAGADCNDAASSCTNDCSDTDGDGHPECLDLCIDVDQDDYGITRTTEIVGSGSIAVADCTTDGTTSCTFLDAVCAGTDCDDAASSCTTNCADEDGDGVPECLDLCRDFDKDDYGVTQTAVIVGAGSIPVGSCTIDGTTACDLSQDAVCDGSDCDDAASSCTTNCADEDGDGVSECLDLCRDFDKDDYGVTQTAVVIGNGSIAVGACTTNGTAACDLSGDAACIATDCNDAADSCTTNCADEDGDGVAECLDLCRDFDFDDHGVDQTAVVVGNGTVAVGACTTNGSTPCSLTGDAACVDLDCDDDNDDIFPKAPKRCDGYHNDCEAWTDWSTNPTSATPDLEADEIDNDLDGYVECVFSSGVNVNNWGDHGGQNVLGGGDCNDLYPTVSPDPAEEYCDGFPSDCEDWDYDAQQDEWTWQTAALPDAEADMDADDYVACVFSSFDLFEDPGTFEITPANYGGGTSAWATLEGDKDCDDWLDEVYPGAEEVCDGYHNRCDEWIGWANDYGNHEPDLADDEYDDDGDGFVECALDIVDPLDWGDHGEQDGTIVGGEDCNDALGVGDVIFPRVHVATGQPLGDFGTYEADPGCYKDADGDGWADVSPPAKSVDALEDPLAGHDCDDVGPAAADIYPDAPKLCDGWHNDCEEWAGWEDWDPAGTASFEAEPALEDDEIDGDLDGYVVCTLDIDLNATAWGTHGGQAGEIDGGDDCHDAMPSVYPNPAVDACDGFVSDCDSWTSGVPNAAALQASERDDDGDGFVDCEFATVTRPYAGDFVVTLSTYGLHPDGTTYVQPGLAGDRDCDDDAIQVHPGATEVCDGYHNRCENWTGWSTGWDSAVPNLPLDEIDNDGDRYVECDLGSLQSSAWGDYAGQAGDIDGGLDCNDTDTTVYYRLPSARPVPYEPPDAGSQDFYEATAGCYRDADGDGYGDITAPSTGGNPVAASVPTAGSDCIDTHASAGVAATIFPQAPKLCDGWHNDCSTWSGGPTGSPALASAEPDEIDKDGDRYVQCALDVAPASWGSHGSQQGAIDGGRDCFDVAGNSAAALTHPNRTTHEADNTLCMRDVDGDGWGDLHIPDPPFAHPDAPWTAGSDCHDTSSFTYPGVATLEELYFIDLNPGSPAPMKCQRDEDGDGWGASTLPLGLPSAVQASIELGLDCTDLPVGLETNAGVFIAGANIRPTRGTNGSLNGNRNSNETWYDNVDQNCDGESDFDQDGDGQDCTQSASPFCPTFANGGRDCADGPTGIGPFAASQIYWTEDRLENETWYDGIDQNCRGDNDYDQDGDGYVLVNFNNQADVNTLPGDCVDSGQRQILTGPSQGQFIQAADINPGATEVWYDGVDQDCDNQNDYDQDDDGYIKAGFGATQAAGLQLGDCEDEVARETITGSLILPRDIFPGATDPWYDGVDQNCDGNNDFDQDRDGYVHEDFLEHRGGTAPSLYQGEPRGDCVDSGVATTLGGANILAININPSRTEVWYDGVDQDCDGWSDFDQDRDTYDCDGTLRPDLCPGITGPDCDDLDAERAPQRPEVCDPNPLNQIDQDCDGNPNTQDGVYFRDADQLGSSARRYYIDLDRDREGDKNSDPYFLCQRNDEPDPTLFVTNNLDCDDDNPDVNTQARELCNALDDNCNGQVDEPTPNTEPPPGCLPHYIDEDQDGVGTDSPGDGETLCICAAYADDPQNKLLECNPGSEPDPFNPLLAESNSARNVTFGGDCWSEFSLDCNDNDPSMRPPLPDEPRVEYLDGRDNDCDGRMPLAEIDCDNDGSYALVPNPDVARSGFVRAEEIGLAPCDDTTGPIPSIQCFNGTEIGLICDSGPNSSGLWMVSTTFLADIDEGAFFRNGRRVGQITQGCTPGGWDCDDLCPQRCEGRQEACDGIDNDCNDAINLMPRVDFNGVPDPMDSTVAKLGYVVEEELDLDGDNQITCTGNTFGPQVRITDAACPPNFGFGDCNDLCVYVSPLGTDPRCTGFPQAENCVGTEGPDGSDGDRFRVCGVFGTEEGAALEEDLFILVHADGDVGAEEEDELARIVPLIPPRRLARQCDTDLQTALDALGVFPEEGTPDNRWWVKSLTECVKADTCRQMAQAGHATDWPTEADCEGYEEVQCGAARITLSDEVDANIYQEIIPGCMDESTRLPEQVITRTVWRRDRIVMARRLVAEWECYRTFGTFGCGDEEAPEGWSSPYAGMVPGGLGFTPNALPRRLLLSDGRWWKEFTRYNPQAVQPGSLAGCWGDPDQGIDALRSFDYVGGDCDPDSAAANRDMPEGPDDLVGKYLGAPADCSTCLDGLDNNCNGLIDCQEPACARCFVGQGVGCSAAPGNECTQTGCSSATGPGRGAGPGGVAMLLGLMLAAMTSRRREREG